jgi:hypothetical protein
MARILTDDHGRRTDGRMGLVSRSVFYFTVRKEAAGFRDRASGRMCSHDGLLFRATRLASPERSVILWGET